MDQLRGQPVLEELDPVLVVVRPLQDPAVLQGIHLLPDTVAILLYQLHPHLADVTGDQGDAGEHGGERQHGVVPDLDVALPGAGERLEDAPPPAAAIVGWPQGLFRRLAFEESHRGSLGHSAFGAGFFLRGFLIGVGGAAGALVGGSFSM
ncbi:hypothetical protein D9M70_555550 [compost metagenome]